MKKGLLIFCLLFCAFQASAQNFVRVFGPCTGVETLFINGTVNGRNAYTTGGVSPIIRVEWSGTQWEVWEDSDLLAFTTTNTSPLPPHHDFASGNGTPWMNGPDCSLVGTWMVSGAGTQFAFAPIALSNPSGCGMSYSLPDFTTTFFDINVNSAPGNNMGGDVILSDVNLILEHTFDGDLEIRLRSPSGQTINLITNRGGGGDNFGNPNDGSCMQVTNLNPDAGTAISGGIAPFIGSYRPEGNFVVFNDNSDPNGVWQLVVSDEAGGDVGSLRYLELVFEELGPEMLVESVSGEEIVNGDNSPSVAETTDFGTAPMDGSLTVSRAFYIKNTGNGDLILDGTPTIAISGSSGFFVSMQPIQTTISGPSGSTVFSVDFDASQTGFSCPGLQTATISISNNDSDENPYTFQVQGTPQDNIDPTITCPMDLNVNTDPGQCDAVVTYSTPTGADNCPGQTVNCSLASGSTFSIGTTTVTCTVTDGASNTAQCTFNITVEDNEGPTFAGPPGNLTLSANEVCLAELPDYTTQVGAMDNCTAVPGLIITQAPPAGEELNLGLAEMVTVTATDGAGNSNSISFQVEAVDETPPTPNCPDATISTDPGECTATSYGVSFIDNCGIAEVLLIEPATLELNVGTTTVIASATDIYGNTAQCTAMVTVNDIESPDITCPTALTQSVDASCQSSVPDLTAAIGDVIANSSAEFSNTQGQNGWFYGKYVAFDTDGFMQLPNYTGFVWNNPGTNLDFPQLDANGGHPQFEDFSWPIRRWVSDFSGQVQIAGDFFDRDGNCGDGAHVRIFQNGAEVFQYLNIPTSSTPYSINLTISVGDRIDFAIDPKFDVSCDDTHFTAVITAVTGNTSSDNCSGVVTITQMPTAGTALGLGTTTVILTATDDYANTSTCSVNVTVVDNIPPTANCNDVTVFLDASGQAIITPAQLGSASDNCVGTSISSSPAIVDCSNIGQVSSIVSVTDNAGNTASCSSTITVADNIPPTVSCPADITEPNDAGACNANVTFNVTASDNCSVTTTANPVSGSSFSIGTTAVSVTAMDGSGNTATCSFNVTVNDTEAPTANCPADVTAYVPFEPVTTGACEAEATFTIPDPTDNCPGATAMPDIPSGSAFGLGDNPVTVTAMDATGNTATCSFNVTVIDNSPPYWNRFPVAASVPIYANENCMGVLPDYEIDLPLEAVDKCGGDIIYTQSPAPGTLVSGPIEVTLTAEDERGNVRTSTFMTGEIIDDTPPTISCPANINMGNDAGQCGANVSFLEPTGADNCPGQTVNCDATSGDFFGVGTTTVSCTVTDASNNTASCSFNITINDTENPTIVCPSNVSQMADSGQNYATVNGIAPASSGDNCPGSTITHVISGITTGSGGSDASGTQFNEGESTVTYTITDAATNTASCSFTVTVTPDCGVLIGMEAMDMTVECSEFTNMTDLNNWLANNGGATAINACGMVTWTNNFLELSDECGATGTATVTFTVTDEDSNSATTSATFTIEDTTPPAINCPSNATAIADAGECSTNVTFNASASDNCGTATVGYSQASGSSFMVGTTLVTVTATDECTNTATCTFNVTVNDDENPTITCPADINVNNDAGQCGANVTFSTPGGADNCPGQTVDCSAASGDFFTIGTTQVTCTVTDASSNTAECTFNVTVNDSENPTITCPADFAVDNDAGMCGANVSLPAATFGDNCPGASVSSTPASGDFFSVGTTQVTATVTDAVGLTAECTYNVTVNDAENPMVTCPADITVSNDTDNCGANVSFTVNASDNCPGSTASANPMSGSFFSVGTTLVTATATDASGNQSTCTFNITVNDNENPTITCPANISVNSDVGQCGANVTFSTPGGADNCPGQTVDCSAASGDFFTIGTSQVTCTVTDASSNTAECTFNVTVTDSENPTITCPADFAVDNDAGMCGANVSLPAATFGDNCPGASVSSMPASGDFFSVGTSQVTATVTDAVGQTATCTYNVTVNDAEAPMAICQNATVQVGETAMASQVNNGSSDNCDSSPGLSLAPNTFGCVNLGANTVTLTVTDDAGNSASCSATVTVEDNTTPIALCMNTMVNLDGAGNASIVGSDIDGGSSSVCNNVSLGVDLASFDCDDIGENAVILTVTDTGNGNTSTCSATVTVNDPLSACCAGPSANCNDLMLGVDTNGELTVSASLVGAGSTAECGFDSESVMPNMFDCSNVGSTEIVTYTITDVNGASSSCTANITVEDNILPSLVCHTTTVDLQTDGTYELQETDVYDANASTDNCSIEEVNFAAVTYTCADIGESFAVSVTVSDTGGNTASCEAMVTVAEGDALPADPIAATSGKAFCSSTSLTASLANTGVNVSNSLSANERVVWVLTAAPGGSSYSVGDEFTVDNCGDSFKSFGELAVANFSKVIRVDDPGTAPAGTYTFDAYIENCMSECSSALVSGFSITVHAAPMVSITADPDGDICLGQTDVQYDATIMSTDGGTYSYAWCAYNAGDGSGSCFNGFSDNTLQSPTRNWASSAGPKSVGVTVSSEVPGCMATDLYSFNVVAPTMISCPANQTGTLITNSGDFECAATFSWNHPEVLTGPCDPVVLTITISGGSVAIGPDAVTPGTPYNYTFEELGEFTVTYDLVDALGNTSSCSFTITVDGLPCSWVDNGGIGCADNMNTSSFDPGTGMYSLTANNCALTGWPYSTDQLAFVFTELCGDGEIIAQVTDISSTGFAGVMMRDNEDPSAPFMAIGTNQVNKVLKQVRTLPGYPAFPQFVVSYDQFWVRIVRTGNQFYGYASTDGVSWMLYLNQQVFMSNNCIRVGLFTYSEKPGNPITATFDNVFVTGVATPLAPGGETLEVGSNLGGFENFQGLSKVSLYPNPAASQVTLEWGELAGQAAEISIFNTTGQLVKQLGIDVLQFSEQVEVSDLNTGVYNIVIKVGDALITERLVIARP